MVSDQQTYLDIIDNLSTVSEEEKVLLLRTFKKMDNNVTRNNFMLKRVQKDKEITTNILNATIEDLEKHKKDLEIANSQLYEQKTIIEESLRKLEASYAELEQFSYIASHDLKSPLRTISSFAQLLKRRYYNKLDQDANEFIEFIVSGIQQMNDVIRNSLEYARVGQDEMKHEPVDIDQILKLVMMNLQEDIKNDDAQIILPEIFPMVIGNKTGILQLFQNLISNAIKFKGKAKPIIEISFKEINDFIQFQIKDNGIGIEETYQEHIFLPFKRLSKQTQPGQGIGLAICKKIIENHKGRIELSSKLNEGTTFFVTLPLYPKNSIV